MSTIAFGICFLEVSTVVPYLLDPVDCPVAFLPKLPRCQKQSENLSVALPELRRLTLGLRISQSRSYFLYALGPIVGIIPSLVAVGLERRKRNYEQSNAPNEPRHPKIGL